MFWWPFKKKQDDWEVQMRTDYLQYNQLGLPWEVCWLPAENVALFLAGEEGNDW